MWNLNPFKKKKKKKVSLFHSGLVRVGPWDHTNHVVTGLLCNYDGHGGTMHASPEHSYLSLDNNQSEARSTFRDKM